MTYYCFLCNDNHNDVPSEEHFIPRSIYGPRNQWLPVCEASNARSNAIFDNDVRDLLYMERFRITKILKRTGVALLGDGSVRSYKFAYDEPQGLKGGEAFYYFFDKKSKKKIPSNNIYAIKFSIGLDQKEQETFCRGLAKISIGALAYLLGKEGVDSKAIKNLFSQTSIDSIRHFALKLPWHGSPVLHRFSLGRSDVLSRLQPSCENPQISNHVIEIIIQDKKSILIEGMLFSKYGWQLNLLNNLSIDSGFFRLENGISEMLVPMNLRDLTLTPDSICIINPNYKGRKPTIPPSWNNE